jgi:hypothetical protein
MRRRRDQHNEGRQQRNQHRVVQQVDRPHAARDLPHGGTREGLRVPVGRQALHAGEGVVGEAGHVAQRQPDDGADAAIAQRRHGRAERHHAKEQPQRRAEGRRPAVADGIGQPACEQRHRHVAEHGGEHQRNGERRGQALPTPAGQDEAQGGAERVRLPGNWV